MSSVWIARAAPLFIAAAAAFVLTQLRAPVSAAKNLPEILNTSLAGGRPNPIGSAENRVRSELIVRELEAAGYEVEVQGRFVCSELGACGKPRNILAERKGRSTETILVAAHYDSVGAGPGAWDNAAGVAAVLETARAIAAEHGPELERTVLFLFDDGEEAGLLGAQAFVAHPKMRDVRAVVNVDGMSGLSAISVLGPGRAGLVDLIGPRLPRPFISSAWDYLDEFSGGFDDSRIFLARELPVIAVRGLSGGELYHTRRDSLDALDPDTIAHKIEVTREIVLALAKESRPRETRKVAFFDVANLFVLRAGQVWWIALAAAALILLLKDRPRAPLAPAIALSSGAALAWIAGAALHDYPAMIAAAPAAAAAILLKTEREKDPLRVATTLWTPVAAFGLAAAIALPELAPLPIIPALTAALAVRAKNMIAAAILPGVAAAILLAPIAHVIDALAGFEQSKKLAALIAVLVITAAPAFAGWSRAHARRATATLAIIFASAVLIAIARPREHELEHASVRHEHDALTHTSRWLYFGQRAPENSTRVEKVYPWSSGLRPAHALTSTLSGARAPSLEVLSRAKKHASNGDQETIRAALSSPRGAAQLTVALPPKTPVLAVRVEGEPLQLAPANIRSSGGFRLFTVYELDGRGSSVIVELDVPRGAPAIELILLDVSYGLPTEPPRDIPADRLPRDMGDSTSVRTAVEL